MVAADFIALLAWRAMSLLASLCYSVSIASNVNKCYGARLPFASLIKMNFLPVPGNDANSAGKNLIRSPTLDYDGLKLLCGRHFLENISVRFNCGWQYIVGRSQRNPLITILR